MKIKIGFTPVGFFLFVAIFLIGITPTRAQIDSNSVVTSSDSTIIKAEEIEESAQQEPIPTSVDQVIAQRLKTLQNKVPLVYNPKIKGFIDYFTIRNPRYAKVGK